MYPTDLEALWCEIQIQTLTSTLSPQVRLNPSDILFPHLNNRNNNICIYS